MQTDEELFAMAGALADNLKSLPEVLGPDGFRRVVANLRETVMGKDDVKEALRKIETMVPHEMILDESVHEAAVNAIISEMDGIGLPYKELPPPIQQLMREDIALDLKLARDALLAGSEDA
jgi:hypothetical protein